MVEAKGKINEKRILKSLLLEDVIAFIDKAVFVSNTFLYWKIHFYCFRSEKHWNVNGGSEEM